MTHRLTPRAPLTATLALLALGIPALTSGAVKQTERVERTVPMQSGGTLTLKNFSGRVEITGEPRSDVAIVAVRKATRVPGSTGSSSTSSPMAARSLSRPTSATRTGARRTTTSSKPTSPSRCRRAPTSISRCSAAPCKSAA